MQLDRQTVLDRLRATPLFGGLPPDALRAVGYLLRPLAIADGDVLFREGDAGNEAFVVLEGEVEIVGRLADGSERVRAVLGAGQLFGELALFGGGERSASARARGRVVLGALGAERLREVIRGWPDVALALLRMQAQRFLELERAHREVLV